MLPMTRSFAARATVPVVPFLTTDFAPAELRLNVDAPELVAAIFTCALSPAMRKLGRAAIVATTVFAEPLSTAYVPASFVGMNGAEG